jgi:hypothetical protein
MNDQSYNEPRLDENPAVDIINARKSYYIGKMEVPIRWHRPAIPEYRITA